MTPITWRGASVELRTDAFSDDDLLADGVLLGPELFGQGVVNDHHTGSRAVVLLSKVAPAQKGNLEDGKIAGRRAHPTGAAGPGTFVGGAANDVEGQAVTDADWQAAGERRFFDAGNGVETLTGIVRHLGDTGGFHEAIAG